MPFRKERTLMMLRRSMGKSCNNNGNKKRRIDRNDDPDYEPDSSSCSSYSSGDETDIDDSFNEPRNETAHGKHNSHSGNANGNGHEKNFSSTQTAQESASDEQHTQTFNSYRCFVPECDFTFTLGDQLTNHMNQQHREFRFFWPCHRCKAENKGRRTKQPVHFIYFPEEDCFKCAKPECHFLKFIDKAEVNKHLAMHQAPNLNANNEDNVPQGRDTHKVIILSMNCPMCQVMCKDRAELDEHLAREHDIQRHRCLIRRCTATFEHSAQLSRHLEQTHSEQIASKALICGQCSKVYPDYGILIKHHRANHEIGHYKCSYYVCGFTMANSNRKAMSRHVANHMPSKNHKPVRGRPRKYF